MDGKSKMKAETYNPNKLAHQDPIHPISEWMEYNDLENERDWETDSGDIICRFWKIGIEEMKDSIWEDINKGLTENENTFTL